MVSINYLDFPLPLGLFLLVLGTTSHFLYPFLGFVKRAWWAGSPWFFFSIRVCLFVWKSGKKIGGRNNWKENACLEQRVEERKLWGLILFSLEPTKTFLSKMERKVGRNVGCKGHWNDARTSKYRRHFRIFRPFYSPFKLSFVSNHHPHETAILILVQQKLTNLGL